MRYTLFFSLSLIFIFSCDDDNMEPTPPPPPSVIQFGGVHLTDVNGNPIGGGDPTDWNLEDNWEDQVYTLFNDERNDLCPGATDYKAFSAYPNPAQREIFVLYNLKDSADLQLRVVDRDYQLLREININRVFGPGFNNAAIRLDDLNLTDTVRFYYKLVGKNCELRGHGDVIIE